MSEHEDFLPFVQKRMRKYLAIRLYSNEVVFGEVMKLCVEPPPPHTQKSDLTAGTHLQQKSITVLDMANGLEELCNIMTFPPE